MDRGNQDTTGLLYLGRRDEKIARAKQMHEAGVYRAYVKRARHEAFLKKVQREAHKHDGPITF